MTNRLVRKQSLLICPVVTLLILAIVGTGQAEPINTPSDIGQASAQIVSLINSGKTAEADAAVDKLIADIPVSREKGTALQQIAGTYQNAGQFDRAIKLCDYVLRNWPRDNFAVWAAMSMVISQVDKGDTAAAEGTTLRMTTDYAGNADLPTALCVIADVYSVRKMYDKAEQLYGAITDKFPNSPTAAKARMGMAGMEIQRLIESGSSSSVKEKVNSMIADFNNEPCLPDVLFRIGREIGWRRSYEESKYLFDRLTEQFPDSGFVPQAKLWSAWSNACSLVRKGQDEQALTAIDGMISDFKGDPGLADAVQWIGRESEWTKGSVRDSNARYNMPASIYQKLTKVTDWQQAEWNDKRMAHRTKILTLMDKGDEKEIDSAIEQMAADLAGRPELSNELYWVAVWYEEHRKPEKAQAMYERMAIEFPDSNEGKESVHHALRVAIQIEEKTGVEGTAQEIIERWKEQLKGTSRLVSVLYLAGNAYYAQAIICEQFKGDTAKANIYRAKAANIFSEVISLTGDSTLTAGDCSLVANCYRKSGKLSEAIRYYKVVADKWPGSPPEADCLEGIYGCYEELVKQGQISQGQADANLEPVYNGLIAKFPQRLDTPQTLLKLGWLNLRQNKWQDGIGWLEKGLEKFPKGNRPADVLYAAGRYYQKSGQTDKAIAMYEELRQALPAGKQLDEINITLDQLKKETK